MLHKYACFPSVFNWSLAYIPLTLTSAQWTHKTNICVLFTWRVSNNAPRVQLYVLHTTWNLAYSKCFDSYQKKAGKWRAEGRKGIRMGPAGGRKKNSISGVPWLRHYSNISRKEKHKELAPKKGRKKRKRSEECGENKAQENEDIQRSFDSQQRGQAAQTARPSWRSKNKRTPCWSIHSLRKRFFLVVQGAIGGVLFAHATWGLPQS